HTNHTPRIIYFIQSIHYELFGNTIDYFALWWNRNHLGSVDNPRNVFIANFPVFILHRHNTVTGLQLNMIAINTDNNALDFHTYHSFSLFYGISDGVYSLIDINNSTFFHTLGLGCSNPNNIQ